jgi:pathogenesis-related protein 1
LFEQIFAAGGQMLHTKTTKVIRELICFTLVLSFALPVPATESILQPSERNAEIAQRTGNRSPADRQSIGSDLSSQEVRQVVDMHNRIRADVGVGPVSWSNKLAAYAQRWADRLASTHCALKHRPSSGEWKQLCGENLFMGTVGRYGVVDAVKAWESEKAHYRGQPLHPSDSYDIGHYTQMVWRHSKQIGCAKAECLGNLIVVCNYDPPGNVLGQKPY